METESVGKDIELLVKCLKRAAASIPEASAIAYSGGLDSSILFHLSNALKAYTFGLAGSHDIQSAKNHSALLHKEVIVKEVSRDLIAKAADIVVSIDADIKANELGYETLLCLALMHIESDVLVTGQGADEIFYGYKRFMSNEENNEKSIQKLFDVTLPREKKIAQYMGKRLITPYLEGEILNFAKLPKSAHIVEGTNKFLLRRAAVVLGLPVEIAMQPKKAAQFGSGLDRVIRGLYKTH